MQKRTNVNYELLKKKYFKKNEIKELILKSIFQNQNIQHKSRIQASQLLEKNKKLTKISFQKNLCLISGKYKSNWSFSNLSRHTLKKLNLTSSIINLKKRSW